MGPMNTPARCLFATILAVLSTSMLGCGNPHDEPPRNVLESIDALPVPAVHDAGFGRVGTTLLLWGGTPSNGRSEDATTDRILQLDLESNDPTWHALDVEIPVAIRGPVSLTHPDRGALSIGGSTVGGPTDDAWLIQGTSEDDVRVHPLPSVPAAIAGASGTLLGDQVLLIGGRETALGPPLDRVWRLDLATEGGWQAVDPIPGPGRVDAVAGTHRSVAYVVGGIDRQDQPLLDVWRYDPALNAWHACSPLPRPMRSPCESLVHVGWDMLAVIDEGEDLLVYHPNTDRWSRRDRPDLGPIGLLTSRGVVPLADIDAPVDGETIVAPRTTPVVLGLANHPSSLAALDWIAIAGYGVVLLGLGAWCARRENSTDEFFLAGRRIPWWASGISIFATSVSAITFMAIPAKSWDTDWTYFLQSLGVIIVAPIAALVFVPAFRRTDLTTAYEFLERRFHWSLRLAASANYMFLQVGRVALVTLLPALALAAVTGLDVTWCIVIMGAVCIVYTVLGGIEAVIWSDVLQVVVLFGGAFWALVVMVQGTDGGLTGLYHDALNSGKLRAADWSLDLTRPSILAIALGAIFANLIPYASDQSVVQRYLAVRDEREAKRAVLGGAMLAIPAAFIFFGLGTGLWAFYRSNPEALQPTGQLDQILPLFVVDMLPTGVAGVVLAGLFAAAMSSLDSAMNSVSTAFTTDWYQRFRPSTDDRHRLRVARIATVGIGTIGTCAAILMARLDDPSLLDVWFKVIGLFGSGIAGVFILGVSTHRTGAIAGWSGLVAGAVTVWSIGTFTSINGLTFAAFGIVACLATGLLVGVVDRRSLPQP